MFSFNHKRPVSCIVVIVLFCKDQLSPTFVILLVAKVINIKTPGSSCSKGRYRYHWINLHPVDNAIGFPNTYPLDYDFSAGYWSLSNV